MVPWPSAVPPAPTCSFSGPRLKVQLRTLTCCSCSQIPFVSDELHVGAHTVPALLAPNDAALSFPTAACSWPVVMCVETVLLQADTPSAV